MERLKFLSDIEVQAMHEATLHIMSEVGIIWTHKPSLDILLGAGCTLKGNRVCMPADLVMDCIAKANNVLKFAVATERSMNWAVGIYISTTLAVRVTCSIRELAQDELPLMKM